MSRDIIDLAVLADADGSLDAKGVAKALHARGSASPAYSGHSPEFNLNLKVQGAPSKHKLPLLLRHNEPHGHSPYRAPAAG